MNISTYTSVRTVDENWSFFQVDFQSIIYDLVPLKTICKNTGLPWFTIELTRLIRKKKGYTREPNITSVTQTGLSIKTYNTRYVIC